MKRWLIFVATLVFLFSASSSAEAQTVCEYDGNPYRPGGSCKETVPYVDANIADYEPSCSSAPEVNVSFDTCGRPGVFTCPNGQGDCIGVNTLINMSQARLGGLGPDENAVGMPADYLAQYYPFTALGGLPLDLTRDQPKEAFRTFWRLTTKYQQFDAKAKFFQRYLAGVASPSTNRPIFNSEIAYYPVGFTPTTAPGSGTTGAGEDKYGVNIGYGHIQQSFCELSKGKPTVILVPMGETNIAQYTSCYGQASRLIVRVMGLNSTQSSSELTAAGARIAQICNGISNCVIEFGNEVNNAAREYSCSSAPANCGAIYASQFAAFKAGAGNVPVGAAALDIYNTDYPYRNFLTGAQPAYNSSDVAFANVYCLNTSNCDVQADIETVRNFNGGKDPFITEYGLGPTTTSSMKEWVDWARAHIPSQEVSLLVPNLCPQTASGVWIHYKNGVVTDLNGKRIEPSSCAGGPSLAELPSITIQDLYNKLPGCLRNYPVCADALIAYNNLDQETKIQYDTLLPFDLDNARGYLALRQIKEDRSNSLQILGENLPYVQAIHDMLLQPSYGILQTLSPAWVNTARNLVGNGQYYTAPIGVTESPSYSTIGEAARSVWALDKGVGFEGCRRFDKGTNKPAPLTYPNMIHATDSNLTGTQLSQDLAVPIKITQQFENGEPKLCKTVLNGVEVEVPASFKIEYDAGNVNRQDPDPVQDNVGRSILVLNNPKMTDISTAISETKNGENYSLTSSFLPEFSRRPYVDTPILAKSAEQSNSRGDNESKDIARKDGRAEIDLCEMRNFWLMPKGMQRGSKEQCENQNAPLTTTSAATASISGPKGDVKQHLYEPSCNGQVCFEYIVSQLAGAPRCNGKYLNPYVGIAISLNETGGLVSNLANGANIKHFGCDPFNRLGVSADPVSKFQCMANTLTNDCQVGKSDTTTLTEYGYKPGNNLNSLVDILGGSETCRGGYCFSLFVDQTTAQNAAINLRNTLPGQQDLWARYYSGYINSFTDAMRL